MRTKVKLCQSHRFDTHKSVKSRQANRPDGSKFTIVEPVVMISDTFQRSPKEYCCEVEWPFLWLFFSHAMFSARPIATVGAALETLDLYILCVAEGTAALTFTSQSDFHSTFNSMPLLVHTE